MDEKIECSRKYNDCKINAEGHIQDKPVCVKCLEHGERKDFIKFE